MLTVLFGRPLMSAARGPSVLETPGRVVNAYDDFVGASLESDRKLQAVERLELAVDRDYDPSVVDVLSRIVERQTEYAY